MDFEPFALPTSSLTASLRAVLDPSAVGRF